MTVRRGFFDSDGRLLRELDEGERHAISAVCGRVAKQHTCMVVKNGGKPSLLGSGTFVQVGGRTFVATAKHLFNGIGDDELIALYWGEEDHRAGAIKGTIALHEQLDLAAVPMPADTLSCGVLLSNLDLDCSCTEDDLFVVSGIPGEKYSTDDNTRTVVVGHWSLGLVCLPDEAWPKNPGRALSHDVDMLFNYTKRFALDDQGGPMPQIAPFGLSGGGVWSVPRQADGVWSPGSAKLVGVQSGVEKEKWKYLRATKIKHWLRLMASTYPET